MGRLRGAGNAADQRPGWQPREDATRSIRLSVLKRDLTIRGFSPQLSVTHERHESNAQQDDCRRTEAEISFVRQFRAELREVRTRLGRQVPDGDGFEVRRLRQRYDGGTVATRSWGMLGAFTHNGLTVYRGLS